MKIMVFLFVKFPSLALSRNAIMLQHHTIQFPFYYLSRGLLQEAKNKIRFHTFHSENGCGPLQEMVSNKRFQM